jgi:hypothetical protein
VGHVLSFSPPHIPKTRQSLIAIRASRGR